MKDRQPSPDPAIAASDRELLTRFVTKRDEAAFRLIVSRHSALVWSVCRRMLRSPQDQEDVFQATFLKLVIEANRQPWQATIGGWLHKVAYRLSLNLRALQKRRQEAEFLDEPWIDEDALEAIQRQDMELALHRALSRLSARHREALVLYYFQNKSQEEAAAAMHCSVDAMDGILKRGRRKLLFVLGKQGLSLSLALVAMERTLRAAPHMLAPQLIDSTVIVGSCHLATETGTIPLSIATLCRGKFAAMLNSANTSTLLVAGTCSLLFCWGSAGVLSRNPAQDTSRIESLLVGLPSDSHISTSALLANSNFSDPPELLGTASLPLAPLNNTSPTPQQTQPAEEAPEQKEVARWIKRLNSNYATVRDSAEKELLKLGSVAKAQLEAAKHHKSLEVRSRAERLLVTIREREVQTRTRDLKAQLSLFLTGKQGVRLPGWEQYKQIVGDTEDTRLFFSYMQRGHHSLLQAYQQGPREAADRFEKEYVWPNDYPELRRPARVFDEELASMLLVAGDERVTLSASAQRRLSLLITHARLPGVKSRKPANYPVPILRNLLTRWLKCSTGRDMAEIVSFKLKLAIDQEHLPTLISLATDPKLPVEDRATAVAWVAFLGDYRHIGALEPLLDDATEFWQGEHQIPFCDVVLSALVQISCQSIQDYGHEHEFLFDHSIYTFKFENPSNRALAQARWRSWSQEASGFRDDAIRFAKGSDKSPAVTLPGWKRYCDLFGDSPESRTSFANMICAESELLRIYENLKPHAPQANRIDQQIRRCCTRQSKPNISASIGSLLLVASDERLELSPESTSALAQFFDAHRAWKTANEPQLAELLRTWMKRQASPFYLQLPELPPENFVLPAEFLVKRQSF